jgi:glutathione synthase/RimK-type ligase-like ATP-grasp enzyme
MRIALATARELPRPDGDLPVLAAAAAVRGWTCVAHAWDEADAAWSEHDVVLVRSTWDYVAKRPRFRRWIEATSHATVVVNAPGTLQWNLHKGYLLELEAHGVPIVPTALLAPGVAPDWDGVFSRHGELVLKPAESAGSFGTVRVRMGDHALALAHRAEHADRDLLVQPFLPSVIDRGETNLVMIHGAFSHAVRKGARWAGQPEQSRGLVEPTAEELDVAHHVLKVTHQLGHGVPAYARVDLAIGRCGRPLLMELELVEPSLFLDRAPSAADRLLDAVADRVAAG